MSNNHFTDWVENNNDILLEQWKAMSNEEKKQKGPTLDRFIRRQYHLLPTV